MSGLISQTRNYTKQAEGGIYTNLQRVADPAKPGQVTGEFARAGFDEGSSRDEIMRQKMEMMNSATAMSPFGQVQATDADFQWLQKKRESEAAANLDKWVGTNFHTNDVTTRKWLQEVYPDYYEVREQVMMDRAKFALRVKLLLLRGPKNHKDLILLWGLQTGEIVLDRDWDRIGPDSAKPITMDGAEGEQTRFKNGLLNPRRYYTDSERALNQAAGNNPFKPTTTGPGGGQIPGFMGSVLGNQQGGRYTEFMNKLPK